MSSIDRRDRLSARRRTLEQRLALTHSPALAATVAALRQPMLRTLRDSASERPLLEARAAALVRLSQQALPEPALAPATPQA